MEEQWKDIVIEKNGIIYDYTSLYQVSNLGRVRSLIDNHGKYREHIFKAGQHQKNDYLYIKLCKNGKTEKFYIHRLVATMFLPNPNNLPVVNHKDENPSNNRVENLEWCTAKYNVNYGTAIERRAEKLRGTKRSEESKQKISNSLKGHRNYTRKVICLETKQIFNCIKDAEKWCGKTGVGNCLKGRQKTCAGYRWMYYDEYKRQLRMESDINNSKQLIAC